MIEPARRARCGRRRRFVALVVVLALLATACGGSDDLAATTSTSDGAPDSAPSTVPRSGSAEELRTAFTDLGITVIDDPASGAGSQPELWSWQVESMAGELDSGSGYLGSQLDALAGAPGGIPFSYLLAGWIVSAPTPSAETAARLMGDQPWEQATSIVFPSAVLFLFVTDAIQAAESDAARAPILQQVSFRQIGNICSTLSGWVNDALDFIFESLKVNVEGTGFLDWLGIVWNAAVDLVRGVIEGLITALTAPVIAAISEALAVVGTLSMVSSLMKPWTVALTPTRADTRFAVGDEPDIEEHFVASVDTGIEIDWPETIEDCADVAGLELPDPSDAQGSEVTWTTAGLPELGVVTRQEPTIDDENLARLDWITGREESDRGDPLVGTLSASVTVRARQIEQLKAMLETLIADQIPVPPFGDIVAALFSSLTQPVFDALAELIQASGAGSVAVRYHDEVEEPLMGWSWVLESTRRIGVVSDGQERTKSARIVFEFAEGQDPAEPFPRYEVVSGTITFHALGYTDATGCSWSAPEVTYELTPDLLPTDPQAEFSQNYLYFDTTIDPVEYWGVVQSSPGPPETVVVNCPDSDLGARTVDYTGNTGWLKRGPGERLPVKSDFLIEGTETTGSDTYSTYEWTITRDP